MESGNKKKKKRKKEEEIIINMQTLKQDQKGKPTGGGWQSCVRLEVTER